MSLELRTLRILLSAHRPRPPREERIHRAGHRPTGGQVDGRLLNSFGLSFSNLPDDWIDRQRKP